MRVTCVCAIVGSPSAPAPSHRVNDGEAENRACARGSAVYTDLYDEHEPIDRTLRTAGPTR